VQVAVAALDESRKQAEADTAITYVSLDDSEHALE
jgi:hypothetical protein